MTTDNQEMFECVIPLPDALIRKPMDEPSKSVKHGDHDQSDHGNWAHGGATDRSAGNVSRYIQAHGLKTTVSEGSVADRGDKEKAMWKLEKDTRNNSTLSWDHRNDTPEMRAVRSQEEQLELAATILAQGYKAMREVPEDNWRVIELFAPDGSLAAAAMGTLQDQGNGEMAFAMRFFGSLGTVEGAGTAIMAKSLELAADANAEYRLIKVQSGSHAWYQQWGFDTLDTSGKADMSREQVADWVANYRAGTTKSIKHGDHDQSDHGNWADGSGDGSKDNPIRTNSVEDAARALGEGKHVELRTPDQVAVLLDRLNELAKEAEAAGSKAKNIDLCQLTVPGTNLFCVESKGIPRVEMPQLKGIPNSGSAASDLPADKRGEVDITEAYLERLRSSGVSLTEDEALASHLKATQNELNGGKVAGIMQAARAGELDLNQPIVVSKDGYIVDGHHRWAAKVALEHDGIDDPETDMKIPVVRVDQDILDILESSKQFAADMGLPQVAVKFLKHGDHDQSDHGNWATGGSDGQYTGKPRSAASRARMGEHTDRYGDPERRESGRRSGSRNLGREVTYMEIVALESYKGGGYGEINRFLRGTQEGDDWTKDRIDAVKSLALPTTEPMTVTRMMPLFAVEGIAAGQIYEDKGFMSTGKGDRPAQFFHGYPVQMQIEVPAGTPVVDFDNFTGLDGWGNIEREVTLMPNSQLIIDRVEQRDWNRDFGPTETDGLKIYARLVPPTKSVKHADHDQSEHGNWASANTEKSGPQAWLGINALSDVPKYKIGSPSEASEPQVAARIAENISQFKNAGGVVTRLPILPNAGVTGSYSYAETPEQEATSDWLFREAESARASADEYELRAQDASSQEEQDKLLSIASGYSHMATALDRASGGGTFIATTGGERGTIVGVLAGSFNSGEWEATMFGSSQSVAGTGSALMYAAIEAVADADKVSRLAITFPEPESLPFYRAFGFTPESGTWESKPNPSGVILSRGSAVRIDEAVSGMTPASIVAQYGLTKSIKHGDHDQSDHGNWAHGNAAIPALSATDKKEGEKYLIERYPPEDRNRDSDLGKKLGLTSLEWAAADHYRTQGYMEINNLLRGKGSDWGREFAPADIRSVQLLDKAMDKSTIKTFETVYRGTSMLASKMDTFLSGLEVGGVYTDPSFTSTSRGEDIAESFATDRPPDEAKESRASVMWEIVLPPGTSALDMQSLFPNFGSNEEEVLLDRDTHLRILAKESAGETLDGEPVYRIKAIAIPTATKSLKHADHDQSEHGNWASGGSTPESAQSRALFAKDAPEAYISKNEREELARKWGEKLDRQITERDVLSLDNYKRWGSAEINQYLRGQSEPSGDRKGFVQDRIDGIRNLAKPLDRDTVVYRWVPNETSTGEPISSMLQKAYENGTTVSDSGFMSTSTEVTGGQAWGKNFIAIEVPAGTPVVDFNDWMTTLNAEQEILLMPDTTLMLTYAQTLEDGSRRFVASVVEPAKKSYKHADHDQLDHGSWADGSVPLAKTPIEQVDSLRQWSSNSYDQVNKALRDPKILAAQERGGNREMWQKTQDGLDLLFKGVPPTTRPWTLYRGATGEFVTDLVKQYDSMIAKGEEEYRATGKPPASFVLPRFTDQGFVSTTPDKDVAMHFTGSGFQGGPFYTGDGRAIFEINLPEGSKMVNVEEYAKEFGGFASYAREESEFLLPRGLTFEVTDVTPSDEQFGSQGPVVYTIKLDVIPSSTKSLKHADHDQSDHGSWATGSSGITPPTEDQYKSVLSYTEGSGFINSRLRAGYDPHDISPRVKDLDDLIASQPLSEDTVVYRGGKWSLLHFDPNVSVGQQLTDKAFLSTTTDGGYARTFITQAFSPAPVTEGDKETNIMMEILLPKGFPALDIDATMESYGKQNYKSEHEILLPRGAVLEVTAVEERPLFPMDSSQTQTVTHITAKVVPSSTTKSFKHADHDQSDHGSWATGESAETKFSEDENGAITIYTDQGHMSINGYLRGSRYGGDDQYVPKWVANLDSAIESAGPTTRNMTIYRGISQKHLQELIDGGVLQDAGFASFTKDGETAAGFATGGSMGMRRSDGAVLELDLPAGSAALDMKDAGIPNEQEVLLPRGSRFELISGPEELDLSNEEDNENNRLPVYQIRLVSPTKSLKHGDHDQSDHGNWARGFDAPSTSVPSPANSKTTVPLWWHERDQTVSLDNMRNGMEASVREALDAYTHWSADDGYETGTRLAFHAALNEQLRAGVPRFKAVEAVARLFAEADDEELVAKLGRGFMDIDNALRDSKVKEDMMVTRASSPIMSIQELEAAAKGESINIYGQEIAPGAVYSDAGIISTSADMTYQSTQFFAQNWDSPEGLEDWQVPTTVRWNINLPSGAPALDLRALGFASQHGEDEVLLPRNTHFRIDGVDVQLPSMSSGNAKVTVSATVIPTHSTTKP